MRYRTAVHKNTKTGATLYGIMQSKGDYYIWESVTDEAGKLLAFESEQERDSKLRELELTAD